MNGRLNKRNRAVARAISIVGDQQKLAVKVGVKQATISRWLMGRKQLMVPNMLAIEKATKGAVTVEELARNEVMAHLRRERGTTLPVRPRRVPGEPPPQMTADGIG